MPVTKDSSAPYAPSGVILNLLDRYREKGLPSPITSDVLSRAGVTDSLNSRTLQAFHALDLVDESGHPTPVLEGLRLAPEAEYKIRMGEWLTSAYADALNFINPSAATETEVRDAFRSYKPFGQQERMVSLFLGLFEAAGIAPERKRKQPTKTNAAISKPRTAPRKIVESNTASLREPAAPPPPPPTHKATSAHLPPALAGLMASLPPSGETWSKAERDRFSATFQAVLDFCYPVTPTGQRKDYSNEEDEE